MMEFFDWFTQPLSLGGQMVIVAGTLGAGGVAVSIVRAAISGQRVGAVAAERGSDVAEVVDFPATKVEPRHERVELDLTDLIRWGSAAGAGAGEPDRGDLEDDESEEIAEVLPLLPRAERAALRSGGAR